MKNMYMFEFMRPILLIFGLLFLVLVAAVLFFNASQPSDSPSDILQFALNGAALGAPTSDSPQYWNNRWCDLDEFRDPMERPPADECDILKINFAQDPGGCGWAAISKHECVELFVMNDVYSTKIRTELVYNIMKYCYALELATEKRLYFSASIKDYYRKIIGCHDGVETQKFRVVLYAVDRDEWRRGKLSFERELVLMAGGAQH